MKDPAVKAIFPGAATVFIHQQENFVKNSRKCNSFSRFLESL
jgi:hypothetical protein